MSQDRPISVYSPELLLGVAEQLQQSYVLIARQAEAAEAQSLPLSADSVRTSAEHALQVIDAFNTGLRTILSSRSEVIEPVGVAAVLYDTAQALQAQATQHDVRVRLDLDSRYQPVCAHRASLQAALIALGGALVEGLSSEPKATQTHELRLTAHQSRYGMVLGFYSKHVLPGVQLLRSEKSQPQDMQPFVSASHSKNSGIFTADALLGTMQASLTPSKHKSLHGIGVVLPKAHQLQMV